ncbi:thiamine pyrophosphokinase [Halteromyces radiatus]|uniref:thiamine pyrophosphokinase n=1 Tax=Halteromyces radiatus TaxID=101107 RepID=UPI00221F2489|nr:thiamine pyrophosphokinase [Halteromyces radiatus]KAI8078839.1 thiamine pyrophosphokinase [Halteromyces radiatus]
MNKLNLISHWRPASILATNIESKPFCLIVLNQPLTRLDHFQRLWNNASFKFVADGGSNRLYDAFQQDKDLLEKYLPDEIRGDLDSIRPEVQSYYASKNVPITKISDENSTDFMKCVELLKEKEKQLNQVFDIVATPALGGRFDQTIANINMLYFMKDQIERKVILLSDENLTVLLDKGKHHIHCMNELEGPTCGIMPIGAPATMTTKGLKWNLDNHTCYFGGMVSTSNAIDSNLIEIETDSPLVWTIEIKQD